MAGRIGWLSSDLRARESDYVGDAEAFRSRIELWIGGEFSAVNRFDYQNQRLFRVGYFGLLGG